ncbi:hypothetical protein PVL29_024974 [Vitis rotundifolia]|uniref:Uncharacterized protein n=1 Tax=Vitis rotundifolia TaxID=103349 RepID=A0AA39DA26_VITRO|nr:hypothetical protein PVL29_024974 [Vitis rotundifolia]
MQLARVSSAFPLATIIFFIGIGEMITNEAFDGVYNNLFTIAACLITRLMSHERHDCTIGIRYEQMKANSSFFHMSAMEIKGITYIDVIVIRLE